MSQCEEVFPKFHSILLTLVVADEVLDGSCNAVLLQAVDVRGSQRAGEVRVFGE